MSLILDALHKADRERQNQAAAPGIDAPHTIVAPAKSRFNLWVISALLLFIIALLWVVLMRKPNSAEHIVVASATLQQAPAKAKNKSEPVKTTKSKPATIKKMLKMGTAMSEVRENAPVIPVTNTQSTLSRRIAAQYEALAETSSVEEGNTQVEEVASLYSLDEKSISVIEPAPVVKKEALEDNLAAYPNIGVIRDLPMSIQARIPTLMYSMHEYKPEGRSFIMMNNRQLSVGQKISGDCTLERIVADGILAKIDNRTFKLKALSSWVNL